MKFAIASVLAIAATVSAQSAAPTQPVANPAPVAQKSKIIFGTDRSTLTVGKPLPGDDVDAFCTRTLMTRTCTDQSMNYIADCMTAKNLTEAETRAKTIMERSNKDCKRQIRSLLESGDKTKIAEAEALKKQFKIISFIGNGKKGKGGKKPVAPVAPVAPKRKAAGSKKSETKTVKKSNIPGKFKAAGVRKVNDKKNAGTKKTDKKTSGVRSAPGAKQATASPSQAAPQLTFFERISKAFKKLGKNQPRASPIVNKAKAPKPTPVVVVSAPAPMV